MFDVRTRLMACLSRSRRISPDSPARALCGMIEYPLRTPGQNAVSTSKSTRNFCIMSAAFCKVSCAGVSSSHPPSTCAGCFTFSVSAVGLTPCNWSDCTFCSRIASPLLLFVRTAKWRWPYLALVGHCSTARAFPRSSRAVSPPSLPRCPCARSPTGRSLV